MRKRRHKPQISLPRRQIYKLFALLLLIVINIFTATRITPSTIAISLLFSISLAFMGGLITSFFMQSKLSALCVIYIFVLLTLNSIIGPNILNTILLSSFIIGVALIIK